MIENLDPEFNKIQKEIESDELEKCESVVQSIADNGIDKDILEELKLKTVEERLTRLEAENEKRFTEISLMSLRFGYIMKRVVPMINKLYTHFFLGE